jgi:ribosomal protein L3 glutamine methyltransferase
VCFGHGTASALDEAAALVLHTVHQPYNLSEFYLTSVLTNAERQAIVDIVHRRIQERIPAAYLTHEAIFAGLSFYVDERVLVPRSPIAELIEQRFAPWVEEDNIIRILDLCTGSACIAIGCAYAFHNALVDAVDLSKDALDVAHINVEKHSMEDTVTLYESDLFQQLPSARYDIIVSNPPYVSTLEWTLAEQGILIIEVGSSAETLQSIFPDVPFYWLDFERGGDGIFLLTAEQVQQHHELFKSALE